MKWLWRCWNRVNDRYHSVYNAPSFFCLSCCLQYRWWLSHKRSPAATSCQISLVFGHGISPWYFVIIIPFFLISTLERFIKHFLVCLEIGRFPISESQTSSQSERSPKGVSRRVLWSVTHKYWRLKAGNMAERKQYESKTKVLYAKMISRKEDQANKSQRQAT